MKITIDTDAQTVALRSAAGATTTHPLYSREAFRLVTGVWLKQEWSLLHWQSFSWLGFQLWQLPEDVMRLQEVVATLRPDIIIETGVNRGGSAVLLASLCRALGTGRVISIDIHIPAEVRDAVAACPLGDLITLIEGDSAAPEVVGQVRRQVGPGQSVLVLLDSDHSAAPCAAGAGGLWPPGHAGLVHRGGRRCHAGPRRHPAGARALARRQPGRRRAGLCRRPPGV